MKTKFILFIISIVLSNFLFAQTRICYDYDKAGNRTDRYICTKSLEVTADTVNVAKTPITKKLGEMAVALYPNPTKGQVTLNITNMPDNTKVEISLYDLMGRLIIIQNAIKGNTLLDLSDQPLGIYVLRIRAGDIVSEWKVIKE